MKKQTFSQSSRKTRLFFIEFFLYCPCNEVFPSDFLSKVCNSISALAEIDSSSFVSKLPNLDPSTLLGTGFWKASLFREKKTRFLFLSLRLLMKIALLT